MVPLLTIETRKLFPHTKTGMNDEATLTSLTQEWDTQTLTALRKQSLLETTGIASASLPAGAVSRQIRILAVCLTNSEQMDMLEKVMDLSGNTPPADWDQLTLAELARRTASSQGLSYEILSAPTGARIAITLCATTPEMVGILVRLFKS